MSTGRAGPRRTDVPTLSWLGSARIWAETALLAAVLVVAIGVVGALRFGAPFLATVVEAATDPPSVLAVVLSARALAFALAQRRRDRAIASGAVAVTDDTSVGAMVAVASFATIGLLAAAGPLPLLYTTTGSYRLIAVAVALVVVPASYVLLVYQLGEQVAADRYRRGYRVTPAVYQYLWTLPAVVCLWLFATGVGPVPVSTHGTGPLADRVVHVESADLLYVAAWTPAALAYGYAVRRQVEYLVRGLVPGW